jgi:hypothetical protein
VVAGGERDVARVTADGDVGHEVAERKPVGGV